MKVLRSHRALAMTLFATLILVIAGCNGGKQAATLSSIAVTPKNPSIIAGATQQFTATGTYSDNTTKDLTSSVTWSSGTTATATISTGGLATGVAGGTSTITATSGTVPGTTTLTVVSLVSIGVTPANPTIAKGATKQFTATGTYSDNSTKDLTATVTWSSGTTATATISAGGLATALAVGTSTIKATSGTVFGTTLLTVTGPTLVSIKISPANPTIPVGGTADFTGVGLFSDGSTQPLGPITWSSGTTATASINSTTGVALGLAIGTSTITAVGGGVTGNTLLTVGAATARFAYVANGGEGSISIYAVNGSTFTQRGYIRGAHSSALQAIPDLSGRFVFALNGDNTISTYAVDPVSGSLTDLSTAVLPVTPVVNGGGAGVLPYQGTIDPSGRFLYVANNGANSVTAFTISTTDGSLQPIATTVTFGNGPTMVLTDHTGSFLYVVNNGDSTVSVFAIDANGGLTKTVTGSPFTTDVSPFIATIDPTNSFLYVANLGGDSVSGYKITAGTGVLTALAGSPYSVGVGTNPDAVVVDPTSKYLYTANFATETVSGFSIGSGATAGQLTALASVPTPVSVSPTGSQIGTATSNGSSPFSLSIDPAGKFLAVADQGTNTVALLSLNEATGAIAPAGSIETRFGPEYVNLYIAAAQPTLSPAAAFATNSTPGTISAYTAASTGVLTATVGSVTGVAGNAAATTDVTGQFFFATSGPTVSDLLGFSVTQPTAALTGLSGSPAPLPGLVLGSLVSEPSDRFVYAAGTGAPGSVTSFTLNTTADSITPIAGPLAVTNLQAIVDDPQGVNIYTLGVNLIEQALINGVDGTLTAPAAQTIAPAGTWKSGAIDASGQYLLALDTAGQNITVFFIGPTSYQNGFPPVPVAYGTAMSTKSVGGTTPASLVMSPSPTNRFVYVVDSGANSLTGYTFDPVSATLTAIAGGTTALAGKPGQAAIDATGKFLYVAVAGNPVTNAGSVDGFQINADGTLTALSNSPYAAGVGTAGVAVSNSIK